MEYIQRVQAAIAYAERHLGDELTPEAVAAATGFSLSHFHVIFLAVTGYTVADYLRGRRLSLAAARLVTTRDPIVDIALASGFETQESFTKAFKRLYRNNPGQFRLRPYSLSHRATFGSGTGLPIRLT